MMSAVTGRPHSGALAYFQFLKFRAFEPEPKRSTGRPRAAHLARKASAPASKSSPSAVASTLNWTESPTMVTCGSWSSTEQPGNALSCAAVSYTHLTLPTKRIV